MSTRIVILDPENGHPTCPHEVGYEALSPPPPDAEQVPTQRCVRCGAYFIDVHDEVAPLVLDAIRRRWPDSTAERA